MRSGPDNSTPSHRTPKPRTPGIRPPSFRIPQAVVRTLDSRSPGVRTPACRFLHAPENLPRANVRSPFLRMVQTPGRRVLGALPLGCLASVPACCCQPYGRRDVFSERHKSLAGIPTDLLRVSSLLSRPLGHSLGCNRIVPVSLDRCRMLTCAPPCPEVSTGLRAVDLPAGPSRCERPGRRRGVRISAHSPVLIPFGVDSALVSLFLYPLWLH